MVLIPCYEHEVRARNGFWEFLDQDEDDRYDVMSASGDTEENNATICSMDGDPVGALFADSVTPRADGTITVRVTSTDVDCARLPPPCPPRLR